MWWGLGLIMIVSVTLLLVYLVANLQYFYERLAAIVHGGDGGKKQPAVYSYPIHFEYRSRVAATATSMTGEEACTVQQPYKCTVSKATEACLACGAQNSTAVCVHLDHDTEYRPSSHNSTGERITLPANESADEGYCLSVDKVADRCNPLYGRHMLVQLPPGSNSTGDMALACQCTYPGLIGNTDIHGACETYFMCNGRVRQTGLPLVDTECDCPTGQMNIAATDDVSGPHCAHVSVTKSTGEELTFDSQHSVPRDRYADHVRLQTALSRMIDPCRQCAATGRPVNGRMVSTDDGGYQCISLDTSCIPIRRSQESRQLKGAEGPDAMLAIQYDSVISYGHVNSSMYKSMTLAFHVNDDTNAWLHTNAGLGHGSYILSTDGHQVHMPGHFNNMGVDLTTVPQGLCTARWPSYRCELVRGTRGDLDLIGVHTEQRHYRHYRGTRALGWMLGVKTQDWVYVEEALNPLLVAKPVNMLMRYDWPDVLNNVAERQGDMIRFLAFDFVPSEAGVRMILLKSLDKYHAKLATLVETT